MSHTNSTTEITEKEAPSTPDAEDKEKLTTSATPKSPPAVPKPVVEPTEPEKVTEPSIPAPEIAASEVVKTEVTAVSSEATKEDLADTQPARVFHKALVTDDNYFNRDIFRVALEDVGFTVQEASNGQACLDILAKETFDLMVLDLQMPDVNGLDILRQLDNEVVSKMSILVITANPHMITEEVEEKADFTMQKPVDVSDFSSFAKRIMERIHT